MYEEAGDFLVETAMASSRLPGRRLHADDDITEQLSAMIAVLPLEQ